MDFTGLDRQRAGPVEDTDRAGQIVVGAQIAMELAAVRLLDHQHVLVALQHGGETLGLHRRQQPRRDQCDLDAVAGRAVDRLARRARERTPGDEREIARPLDRGPMVAIDELVELVGALVELGLVIGGAAGRDSAFVVREPVGRLLSAADARNRHR